MNVELELLTHPKYRALRRKAGAEALEYLIRLWGHCSTNKRGEHWPRATAAYVEDVCDWPGQAGQLFAWLVETGFIDPLPVGIIVHNWNEQNSFTVANWGRNPHGRRGKTSGKSLDDTKDKSTDNPRTTHGEPLRVSDKSEESEESECAPAPTDAALPDEAEFMAAAEFSAAGIPPDYLRRQFEKFHEQRAWLNARGQLVAWRRIVLNRWVQDRASWTPEKKSRAAEPADLSALREAIA